MVSGLHASFRARARQLPMGSPYAQRMGLAASPAALWSATSVPPAAEMGPAVSRQPTPGAPLPQPGNHVLVQAHALGPPWAAVDCESLGGGLDLGVDEACEFGGPRQHRAPETAGANCRSKAGIATVERAAWSRGLGGGILARRRCAAALPGPRPIARLASRSLARGGG